MGLPSRPRTVHGQRVVTVGCAPDEHGRARWAVPLLVLIASLLLLLVWYRFVNGLWLGITGDEPHYMLMAYSIVHDGDMDLANNYAKGDADPWYPGLSRAGHAYAYRGDGRLISVHGPGLALLLAPGLALLDAPSPLRRVAQALHDPTRAARLTMIGLSALLLQQFYLLCIDVLGTRRRALVAWAVLATSAPMLFLSSQVYPDIPAALAVLVGVRTVHRLPEKAAEAALAGVICFLPFLHVRYVIFSLALATIAAVRLRRAWRSPAGLILLAGCLLGAGAYLAFHLCSFGSLRAGDQFFAYAPGAMRWGEIPQRIGDLFFEREQGIVPLAPFLLLSVTGVVLALRRRDWSVAWPAALATAYVLLIAMAMSSSGAGPGWHLPWRFLLPILPLMVLYVLYALRWRRWLVWPAVGLVAVGLAVTVGAAQWPYGLYWRDAGVLAVPVLDRVQSLLPSSSYSPGATFVASSGRMMAGAQQESGDGAVCATESYDGSIDLSQGVRMGMHPGMMTVTFELSGEAGPDGARPGTVLAVNERTGETLASHEVTPADLATEAPPITLTVQADRAVVVMTSVVYSGAGTLCLERIQFDQIESAGWELGYWLVLPLTLLMVLLGLLGPSPQCSLRT